MTVATDFADYCCELLGTVGPCSASRMFGGWGIRVDGMNIAILANLGQGDTLWLKVNADTKPAFEAAGCQAFTYDAKGKHMRMNYYNVTPDAMESPVLMAPWARLALEAALAAQTAKTAKPMKKAKPASQRAKTLNPTKARSKAD